MPWLPPPERQRLEQNSYFVHWRASRIGEVLTESSVVSPGGGCGGREAGTLLLELARRALEFAGVVVRGVGHPSTGGETNICTWVAIFIVESNNAYYLTELAGFIEGIWL